MLKETENNRLKLLIVDDSPINHRVVALSLRHQNIDIHSAFNGLEAFELYKQTSFDVILMDARMPVMNGCEATLLIRLFEQEQQIENKAIIIAMTASDEEKDIQHCLQSGMNAFVPKPFVASLFLELLHEKFNLLP